MVVVCVRRHSDSQFSRAIQVAIKGICYQKQCPNEDRITRFVLREFDWKPTEIARQLRLAVKDGLFREAATISHKGTSRGSEQMSYRPNHVLDYNANSEPDMNVNSEPEAKPVVQSHDWYCFDCQESGEVVLCNYCPRVFHKKCAKANYISHDEQWMCPSCKVTEETNSMVAMSKEEVNKMLKFTIERMKEKFNVLDEAVSHEDCPDYHLYIFHPTDLTCIEEDIKKNKFTSPTHFLEEVKWLLHNAIIYFGDDDELTNHAEELVEDAKQEVEEMLLCSDCYKLSNSKPENWFCKPCNPPHEIVWAKMTGQPPWPAKVLKWNEDKTKGLVRFFEPRHQRAWVYFRHISPITMKPDIKKRPRTWLDAQQELQLYLQQLGEDNKIVKTEPEQSLVNEVVDEMVASSSIESYHSSSATASCQTDEDPNKEVIDQLRKRIDDLEQDLRETKENLNLQQTRGHGRQDNGKILTHNTKLKMEKLLATLSERWHRNFEVSELTEEQIRKNFEREQTEYKSNLEELRRKMNEEKREEIEALKASMQVQHDCEVSELRGKTRMEREAFVESTKKISEGERRREVQEVKVALQRRHDDELKKQREASKVEHEESINELKRQQELMLRDTVCETKRKQWCCNCAQEASYPCCWNTSYCSRQCQVIHWQQHRHHCSRNFVYLGPPSRP